jgi:hypothetical protein
VPCRRRTRRTMGRAFRFTPMSLCDDLAMQLSDHIGNNGEHRAPLARQMIVASRSRTPAMLHVTCKPSIPFHSLEQRIQRARAEIVAVSPQLREHPLTNHRLLGCVVKNVDLPEAEQDFPRNQLAVGYWHATTLDGMTASCKIRSREARTSRSRANTRTDAPTCKSTSCVTRLVDRSRWNSQVLQGLASRDA